MPEHTEEMVQRACGASTSADSNPGVILGTSWASPRIMAGTNTDRHFAGIFDLGAWLEQLIAIHRKNRQGIIPLIANASPSQLPIATIASSLICVCIEAQQGARCRRSLRSEKAGIPSCTSLCRTPIISPGNFSAGKSPTPSQAPSSASTPSTSGRRSQQIETKN